MFSVGKTRKINISTAFPLFLSIDNPTAINKMQQECDESEAKHIVCFFCKDIAQYTCLSLHNVGTWYDSKSMKDKLILHFKVFLKAPCDY